MAATLRSAKVGRILLWSALAAVLLTAGLWYFGSRYEWVEDKVRTGMKGEARRNPLHAAQLLFQSLGMPAHKLEDMRQLFELPPRATVILWTAQALDQDQAERLAQWVERGGRVVLDADSYTFNERLGIHLLGTYRPKKPDDEPPRLMIDGRALEVNMRRAWLLDAKHPLRRRVEISDGKFYWYGRDEDCANDAEADEEEAEGGECGDAEQAAAGENRSKLVMVHFALGRGYVTALGNLEVFSNRDIGGFDHAEYLVRVVRLAGNPGPIYLAPDPQYPSLIAWLMEHAWPALLALLALLAAWLWRAMPRFGPREVPPPPARPGLLQHLRAVAEFHLKGRHFAALLAPLQEDCLRALQQHAAREGAAPEPVPLAQRLTGLAAADIERALHAVPAHRAEFLHHASTLSRIRDALTPSHRHFAAGSHQ